jgi:hypothetical protein
MIAGSVTTRSKDWVCGRSLAGIVRMPSVAWMSVVCGVLSGRGLCVRLITRAQRSPIDCGVSECDRETSTLSPLGLLQHGKRK